MMGKQHRRKLVKEQQGAAEEGQQFSPEHAGGHAEVTMRIAEV